MTSAQLKACRRFQRVIKSTSTPDERLAALAEWQSLSQEDISAARNELGRTVSYLLVERVIWKAPLLAFLLGILAPFHRLDWASEGLAAVSLGAFLTGVMASVLTGIVAAAACEVLSGNFNLKDDLSPASERPYRCGSALRELQSCPELIAFRDELVGRGRELTCLDIDYIHHRARQLAYEAYESELQQSCRQLHGLEPASNVVEAS